MIPHFWISKHYWQLEIVAKRLVTIFFHFLLGNQMEREEFFLGFLLNKKRGENNNGEDFFPFLISNQKT